MTCRQLSIDRIGLPPSPVGMRVGLVDLDHRGALANEIPGQPGGVGAGRLDSDALNLAERPEPGKEFTVAASGGRKRPGLMQGSPFVKHCGVVNVGVRVDSADDPTSALVHDLHCCPSLIGGTARSGGPMKSRPAFPAAPHGCGRGVCSRPTGPGDGTQRPV